MKRLFVFFAVLVFLCPILASAGAEGKLDTPVLVSVSENPQLFHPIRVEVEPIPNAEKYYMEVTMRTKETSYIFDRIESDEPVFEYSDWRADASFGVYTMEIWAEAEGYDNSEYLMVDVDVADIEGRPEPPVMNIEYDGPLTNKTHVKVTISGDYDEWICKTDSWSSFPSDPKTSYSVDIDEVGTFNIYVLGSKDGVWSHVSEPTVLEPVEAETLAVPEGKVLSDPLYLFEPVQVEVQPVENAQSYSARIYVPTGDPAYPNYQMVAYEVSEETTFWINEWYNKESLKDWWDLELDAGDYVVVFYAVANGYYDSHSAPVPVTMLPERPEEEKLVITPTPDPNYDPFAW